MCVHETTHIRPLNRWMALHIERRSTTFRSFHATSVTHFAVVVTFLLLWRATFPLLLIRDKKSWARHHPSVNLRKRRRMRDDAKKREYTQKYQSKEGISLDPKEDPKQDPKEPSSEPFRIFHFVLCFPASKELTQFHALLLMISVTTQYVRYITALSIKLHACLANIFSKVLSSIR